jgi:hypothetical protein
VPSCLGPLDDSTPTNTASARKFADGTVRATGYAVMSFGMYLAGILLVMTGDAYGDTLVVPVTQSHPLLGGTHEVGCRNRDRQQTARVRDVSDR